MRALFLNLEGYINKIETCEYVDSIKVHSDMLRNLEILEETESYIFLF